MNTSDNSSTPIVRVSFQLRGTSLELKRWDTRLPLSVGTTIPTLLGQNFHRPTSLATFHILPLEEGRIPNSFFSSPNVNQVLSSVEESGKLLQTVSSFDGSELSVDTSTWTANDQQNLDPAQYYGSTDISTTPSMTTHSIEDGTAHNPILLTEENSTTSISVQPIDPPVIFERSRHFGNEIQNLPEYVVRTLFE